MQRLGQPAEERSLHLRHYRSGDTEALAGIYRDAVIGTGTGAYDPEQIAVWSSFPGDLTVFRKLFEQGLTLVAEVGDRPVAFGQLHPIDHVSLLYTASRHGRRGYAGAIYQALEAHAVAQGAVRLRTEASRLSRPFFEKVGFRVLAPEYPLYAGVRFERFRMEKTLEPGVS